MLAEDVVVGSGCRFEGPGSIVVGPGTVFGERCVVLAHEAVALGARCRLGDGVVLADVEGVFDDVEQPIRRQGVRTSPVRLGDDVVVGPGAAVLPGSLLGDRAVVGARAVVRGQVPTGATRVGVPARAPGRLDHHERPHRPRR